MNLIKKICIIVPSLHKGGLERVASLWMNRMDDLGYNVSVIIITPGLNIDYELNKNIRIIQPSYGYTNGLMFKLKSISFLVKSIKNINPSVILAFSEIFNPLSILAAKIAGKKIFISDRSSPIVKLSNLENLFKKLTYPIANGILAQTNLSKLFLDKYNSNIEVIPNPVRKINDTLPKKYGKTIVSVGRLVESKNFTELINIFAEIGDNDWKLIIIGGGMQYDVLMKQLDDLKLTNQVRLVGKQDDVDKYFAEASIFAFTSLSEGFPNVLNEAMSFPLASISYDCISGPKDLINDMENGILIPINKKELYKQKLIELMNNEELRFGLTKNSICNRTVFSTELITDKVLNFILK